MSQYKRVSLNSISDYGVDVLQYHGVDKRIGRYVMDVLLLAESRGFGSHGLVRLPRVVDGLKAGTHLPDVEPDIEQTAQATFRVDGRHALGPYVANQIMQQLINVSQKTGIALAAAQNLTHFGIGAYYAEMAAQEGLVGLVLCNTEPAAAPFAGRSKVVGTNPISFSCRRSNGQLLTIDMATTAVARGRLLRSKVTGEKLPEHVAVDSEGLMTTDAEAGLAGALLPLGGIFGYKGTALAILVDVLSGALGGAQTGLRVDGTATTKNVCTAGYFFLVIDPEFFFGRTAFERQVDQLIGEIKDTGPDVLLPGEKEQKLEEEAIRVGLDVPPELAEQLKMLGDECGVEFKY